MNVERVEHPLSLGEFLLNYYLPRRPVIIRTASLQQLGWRTHLWTNEYLSYKAGAHEVLVLKRKTGGDYAPERSTYVPMLFRDFVREVLESPQGSQDLYLNLQTDKVLEAPLLQLIGDFNIPHYFKDFRLRSINLWMGNSHSTITTPLHHDFNDNLYVVVEGCKHFTIFPPEQAPNLYTRGRLTGIEPNGCIRYAGTQFMPHLSQIDIQHPDLARYPRYAVAESARVNLEVRSNEMLFLPAGWFHQVNSSGRHIAVSFFAELPSFEGLQNLRQILGQRAASPSLK